MGSPFSVWSSILHSKHCAALQAANPRGVSAMSPYFDLPAPPLSIPLLITTRFNFSPLSSLHSTALTGHSALAALLSAAGLDLPHLAAVSKRSSASFSVAAKVRKKHGIFGHCALKLKDFCTGFLCCMWCYEPSSFFPFVLLQVQWSALLSRTLDDFIESLPSELQRPQEASSFSTLDDVPLVSTSLPTVLSAMLSISL